MDYINELNDRQYEAVASKDKYLRIIAGAGSGKTRVLTYRIAYLIEELNVNPYNILAITFTNKVAKEMKERTVNLLPEYNLDGLSISTFHSFCARFLRREIDALDFTRSFVIFDDEDQLRLLKTIGEQLGYKKSDEIIKQSLNFIAKQKTKGYLPSNINVNELKPNEKKYFNFFLQYEQRKNDCKALDFDDLLIYTIKILKSFPDVKERYNNRFEHILIDEFQDTNDLQFELLSLLMGRNSHLYVVGDPDQTIYTWRGANQKIILNLSKIFPSIKTVILNENYRSTSQILKPANELISFNKDRVKKDLFTKNTTGKTVEVKSSDDSMQEALYVANKILELKQTKPDFEYKDVAILYRSSYLSLKFENVLISKRIPYKVYGGVKFYSRKEIKDCLAYFKLLVNEDDDVSFERIINVPKRKIGETSTRNLICEAREHNLSIIKYIKNIHRFETEVRAPVINKINELLEKMDEVRTKLTENNEAYSEVLDLFLTEIGYKDYLEKDEDTADKIENITALIDDIRTFLKVNPESNFEDYLQNVTLLSGQDDIEDTDNISLMTVHTAKGLEFKYVFIIGFNQGVFPNNRGLLEGGEERLEEERRLAYVAFTRAKKELYITLNKDYSFSLGRSNVPSQFLKEAGISITQNSYKPLYNSSENIYRYNYISSRREENKNVVDIKPKSSTKWEIGDIAIHQVFGEGKVVNIRDEYLDIVFTDFGKKTIISSFPKLSKKQ